ncbi:4Fe-4S dicluster domain-containing protein [bacterium]|nr:4Fe-4S dicluster domain-containing protein [bacterium]
MGLSRLLKWKRRPEQPTYERDRTGDIERWDERDTVFALTDLHLRHGVESDTAREYYERHPEHLEYDTEIATHYGLGSTAGADAPMYQVPFAAAARLASESFVDGEPAAERVEMSPARATEKIKAFARLMGADLVGAGPLRQEWVYSRVGRALGSSGDAAECGTDVDITHHTDAISLGLQMDYQLIQSAPDFPTIVATAEGYGRGAWVAVAVADFIRRLGYSARAHHVYNYRVLAVPVAVDCGLGELSRAGFLMTKALGLGLRLATVTTDMPLEHDGPVDIGVQSFCERCRLCAEKCPSGAIPTGQKVEYNGIMKWKLDEEKCYRFWQAVGTDCSLCMVNCPWTKPPTWIHRLMAAIAGIPGPH